MQQARQAVHGKRRRRRRRAAPRPEGGAGASTSHFVRADWTRRGLGRRILEACEAAARREGFRRLALISTMPGLPLYLAYGFHSLGEVDIPLPDGVTIACVSMDKPIDD